MVTKGTRKAAPTVIVDVGYSSAQEYWHEVVLGAYRRFTELPNRANAIEAALAAWHLHDWV
jgi:hypothetical protein